MGNDSANTLYQMLYSTLRNEIEKGEYKPGEKIPTEMELCKKYNVSRITVRNALEKLTREQYLVRHRGRGTFVQDYRIERSINDEVLSFSDICRRSGRVPGGKTIKCVIEDADEDDIRELKLQPGAKVVVVERIRSVDGHPISVECNRYTDQYEFLIEEDFNNKSLLELLATKYNIRFGKGSETTITIVFASYNLARYLNVSSGYPLLCITSTVCDLDGVPAYRNRQFIVGDKFALTI